MSSKQISRSVRRRTSSVSLDETTLIVFHDTEDRCELLERRGLRPGPDVFYRWASKRGASVGLIDISEDSSYRLEILRIQVR